MSEEKREDESKPAKSEKREAEAKPKIVWRWQKGHGSASDVPNRDLYDYEVLAWVGTRARAESLLASKLWTPVEGWEISDLPNPAVPKSG